jgi:hypothetical protein
MYRSIPLWSWNDKLKPAELERQIEEMHRAGIGGFFMHARGGLLTPYMGEEWMSAVRTCIEKCKELGMSPWLYDENGWPSGFADGKVPALGLPYQQKKLVYERAPFQASAANTIAFYAKQEQRYVWVSAEESSTADLRIYYEVNPYYTDTLNKEAVRAFIESTYDAYWEQFGAEFGEDIQGVFTDEPQFARGHLPWSFELEPTFTSRYGYDVKELLPALFFPTPECQKVRYAYWECVTSMFVQAYAKQIGDWCASKGWSATGHVVDEQTLINQVTSVGDPLAFYEHLQIPGCDWLGRCVSDEPIVPKQVGSVAHQLGKKQSITESYGCSGWNISFQDLKRIGEWQFVHGINLMCQHLQGYSLKGLRKRDYPPSLFVQQPWWEEYKRFNDYFARLSMLLIEGTRQVETLLLHPIRTAWTLQCGEDHAEIVPYHQAFAQLTRWMCQRFIEHDYGSESIIAEHGRVCDGMFIIGEAAYRVVIIPPSITLNRDTVILLKQFVQQGGCLIACNPFPRLINGEQSQEIDDLMESAIHINWSVSALLDAVNRTISPSLNLKNAEGDVLAQDTINVQTLALDGSFMYFLVNSGEEDYGQVHVELLRKGYVTIIDLELGQAQEIQQVETEAGVQLTLPLNPGQSYVLRLQPNHEEEKISATNKVESSMIGESELYLSLDDQWHIAEVTLNSLTLDACRLRVEDGPWSEVQPIIFIQDQLLALGHPISIELEFDFQVQFDVHPDREMYLVLENPESIKIECNGFPIESVSCGTWRDIAFHKIDIRGKVVSGVNHIRLRTYFHNSPASYAALENAQKFESEGNKLTLDTEMESIYLVGSFGVMSTSAFINGDRRTVLTDGPFVLTEMPATVHAEDLVRQGFPFFAGKIRLQQKFKWYEKSSVQVKWCFVTPPDSIVSRLLINGEDVRTFLWHPYDADISLLLKKGENLIEIEMINSCRNLLGPHHHIKGEVYKIGPASFKDKPGWTDKDIDPDTCIYLDRYAFVQFGLSTVPIIKVICIRL